MLSLTWLLFDLRVTLLPVMISFGCLVVLRVTLRSVSISFGCLVGRLVSTVKNEVRLGVGCDKTCHCCCQCCCSGKEEEL